MISWIGDSSISGAASKKVSAYPSSHATAPPTGPRARDSRLSSLECVDISASRGLQRRAFAVSHLFALYSVRNRQLRLGRLVLGSYLAAFVHRRSMHGEDDKRNTAAS